MGSEYDPTGKQREGFLLCVRSSWRDADLQLSQFGWTPVALCRLAQTLQGTSGPFKIQGKTIPADSILNGPTISRRGTATHHDADIALGVCLHVGKGDKLAVIGWFWLTPDGTHRCQILLTACSPIGKGDAKCTKLWVQVAHPDAKEEPSFGEFVETGQFFGQDKGIALWQGCRALPLVSHSTDAQPLVSAHTRLMEASQAAAPCPLVVSKRVARICLTRHSWPKVA